MGTEAVPNLEAHKDVYDTLDAVKMTGPNVAKEDDLLPAGVTTYTQVHSLFHLRDI